MWRSRFRVMLAVGMHGFIPIMDLRLTTCTQHLDIDVDLDTRGSPDLMTIKVCLQRRGPAWELQRPARGSPRRLFNYFFADLYICHYIFPPPFSV